ncbi:hypothetical protein [Streptomyces sp. WAC01280]|uniref:hypothetical protein n=1 Tax=Streptomyces sp. WAC01280 TaxID=2487424 RepID=UPI000F7A1376|nr:hypothetical protein [Streptomyces sp. WAC01280]RSS57487.1 hypothetical protein EF909_16245 [Streptomyces sp. WAC01280]
MAQDLAGVTERFVRFTSLTDVLTKFATEVTIDDQAVRDVLRGENTLRVVAERARYEATRHRFVGSLLDGTDDSPHQISFHRWPCGPEVALGEVRDIRAHEINGHTWCTATARWLLTSHVRPFDGDKTINCAWETRVMLRPTAPEGGVTITRSQRAVPPTPADVPHLPKIEHSHKELLHASRVEREVAVAFGRAISERFPGLDAAATEEIIRNITNRQRHHGSDLRNERFLLSGGDTDPV